MTIKELKEILVHYQGREYDDWEIKLFDYNNQRDIKWNGGTYASSKETKAITFPVELEPVDGECINSRLKRLMKEIEERNESMREGLQDLKEGLSKYRDSIIESGEMAKNKINNIG